MFIYNLRGLRPFTIDNIFTQLSQAVTESAPTGQQALSPGQRPGFVCIPNTRPERAKALCSCRFCPYRARLPWGLDTQGDALGYVLFGLSGRYIPVLTYLRKLSIFTMGLSFNFPFLSKM